MIRVFVCLLFVCQFNFSTQAQLNTSLNSVVTYSASLNDIWGYASGGNEYALVGLQNGVNIQDITDPANPVDKGTASGPSSGWRDIKTFGNYAYATNENTGGLLIIDLSNLPAALTASDWSYWAPTIPGLGTLTDCHNLYIDGNGYGYLAGCTLNSGGVLYIDLFTTPGSPTFVNKAPAIYAHDVFVQNDIMYTSDINEGKLTIYNIADKSNTLFVGDVTTPNNFCHNAWPNATSTLIYTTDERPNAYTTAYDISDPTDIVELDRFRPLASEGTGVYPHNVHVVGDFLAISHYSDGLVIVDASTPDNLIEVGNYDTYTGGGTGYNGAWGVYPYLPSGRIIISDQGNGLVVVTPTYVQAAKISGTITDFITGNPVIGATVTISAPQANLGTTDFFGEYGTGIAASGTYTVTVSKSGYTDVVLSMTLTNGTTQTLNVALGAPLPIDLLSFDASKNELNDALLSWEAVQSDGPFEFEIQRSIDGQEFRTIAKIQEEATAGLSKVFSYVDKQPGSGTHYYRLKLIEPDRSFNYSSVEEISIKNENQIVLFPNPLNKESAYLSIQGEFSARKNYLVNIISPLGEQRTLSITGDALQTIAKDKFATGLNYIEILENGQAIFQSQLLVY